MFEEPRVLRDTVRAYRIGDPRGQFPVWSAEGAKQVPGRWHAVGDEVIYAARHYSTALLERLVYCNGLLPPNQHSVEVTIPHGVSYEVLSTDCLPDWYDPGCAAARAFGSMWYRDCRSAILFVPSVVARMEQHIVVNPGHSDFRERRIDVGLETPVCWDRRLFLDPSPALLTPLGTDT